MTLHELPNDDWNDWELDWQEGQLRRSRSYLPSEKEQAVLARMRRDATPFTEWDGYSAWELIGLAYAYRLDCDEWDQAFLEKLYSRGGETTLRLRQMGRLVRLARFAGAPLQDFPSAM